MVISFSCTVRGVETKTGYRARDLRNICRTCTLFLQMDEFELSENPDVADDESKFFERDDCSIPRYCHGNQFCTGTDCQRFWSGGCSSDPEWHPPAHHSFLCQSNP